MCDICKNLKNTFTVTAVLGNSQSLDGGSMFGNAPKVVWEKWLPADTSNRVKLNCRCLLVQTDQENILLETGIGNFFPPKLKKRFGVQEDSHVLLENLEKLGLAPTAIDKIILSHLHFDHAGGMLSSYNEDSQPSIVFPNAKTYTSSEAYQRALEPHHRDRASFIPELNKLLENRIQLIDTKTHPDFPGFEFYYSAGHTPGHLHTLISGEKHKLFFCGDLIPGTPWVHLPITMGYDRFPEKLIDEKHHFLNKAHEDKWLLFYTHDPSFAVSSIEKKEHRYLFKQPEENLQKYSL